MKRTLTHFAQFALVLVFMSITFSSVEAQKPKPKPSPTPVSKEDQLFDAIENGDLSAVQKLVTSGVNVRDSKNFYDETPIIVASQAAFGENGIKIMQAIIKAGADLETDGACALYQAASGVDAEALNLLLKAGVDVKSRCDSKTALFNANVQNIKFLIGLGLSPNDTDWSGRTPLFEILRPEQVSALLAGGAKVNVSDEDGDTPLINAAAMGDIEVIQLLLTAGADINAKNKRGLTALGKALENQRINPRDKIWPETIKFLRSKGAR